MRTGVVYFRPLRFITAPLRPPNAPNLPFYPNPPKAPQNALECVIRSVYIGIIKLYVLSIFRNIVTKFGFLELVLYICITLKDVIH